MKHSVSIPLILFAALLIWTLMTPEADLLRPTPVPTPAAMTVPDSYASGVTASEFDQHGVLVSRMQADALRRYRGSGLVELDMPQRENFGQDGTWIANADSGLLREDNETLQLRGSVRLRYGIDQADQQEATQESAQFISESMLINLGKKTAISLAPAEAWQGEYRLTAPTIYVALDRKVATFSGGVTSTYAPPR